MSKNSEIKELIKANKEKIFAVDKDYWTNKNINLEQRRKWEERKDDPLVFDGLICGDDERCDILYLLKESTHSGYNKYKHLYSHNNQWFPADRTWDFIQMTNDLIENVDLRIESIWPELCCWTSEYLKKGQIYINIEKEFKEYKKADYKVLNKTAIVNIKKTAGESSSEDELIKNAAEGYGCLIKKEIEIIAPKIVLCGDTFEQARIIWGQKGKKRYKLDCGAQYFKAKNNGGELVFVEFYHPSASVKKAALFAYAKAVFEDLRKEGLIK